jgi:hypothetical protein
MIQKYLGNLTSHKLSSVHDYDVWIGLKYNGSAFIWEGGEQLRVYSNWDLSSINYIASSFYLNQTDGIWKQMPSSNHAYPLCSIGRELHYCDGLAETDISVCSGRGICIANDTCQCLGSYQGQFCEKPVCFGIAADQASVCSANGVCELQDTCTNCKLTNHQSGPDCGIIVRHKKLFSAVGEKFSWDDSNNYCQQHGANLVTIHSGEENSVVYDYVRVVLTDHAWIGMSTTAAFQPYIWVDETDTSLYQNWDWNEPNFYDDRELCGRMYSYSGTWNDMICAVESLLVCEVIVEPFECYGVTYNMSNVCSSHGVCVNDDTCMCHTSYSGFDCHNYTCNGIVYDHPDVCSSNGTCTDYNQCECNEFTTGANCEKHTCYSVAFDDEHVCSGHGNCSDANTCHCENGFAGFNCSDWYCNSILNTNTSAVCHGRGTCVTIDNCQCQGTYQGNDCEHAVCFELADYDPSVCSGLGLCTSEDTCSSCSMTNQQYGPDCGIVINHKKLSFLIGTMNWDLANLGCMEMGGSLVVIENEQENNIIQEYISKALSGNAIWLGLHANSPQDDYLWVDGRNLSQTDYDNLIRYDPNELCVTMHNENGTWESTDCTSTFMAVCQTTLSFDCFGIINTDPGVCNSHGYCEFNDTCRCDDNYYGTNCNNFTCSGILFDNPDVCNSNGVCREYNLCECNGLYAGENCDIPICGGIYANESNVCNSRGSCVSPDDCVCSSVWYQGQLCQETLSITITSPGEYPACVDVAINATAFRDGTVITTTYYWTSNNSEINATLANQHSSQVIIPYSKIIPGELHSISVYTSESIYTSTTISANWSIVPKIESGSRPLITRRSNDVTVWSSVAIPSCIIPFITYEWIVQQVNSTQHYITIPKLSLEIGSYTLYLKVQLGTRIFEDQLTIVVTPTDPIVTINGGSISMQTGQTYSLDASSSYDPDYPLFEYAFNWLCRDSNAQPCLGFNASTNSKQTITLSQVETYYITSSMKSYGDRSAETNVTVEAKSFEVDFPRVAITSVFLTPISISSKTVVTASVTPDSKRSSVELSWTVTEKGSSINIVNSTNTNSQTLVIPKDTLKSDTQYIFTVTARYIGGNDSVYSTVFGTTSTLPANGTCDIAKQIDGKIMVISNWQDLTTSQPLQYLFEYYDASVEDYIPIRSYGLVNTIEFNLASTGNTTIRCSAKNSYGGRSMIVNSANFQINSVNVTREILLNMIEEFNSPATDQRDRWYVLKNIVETYISQTVAMYDITETLITILQSGQLGSTEESILQQLAILHMLIDHQDLLSDTQSVTALKLVNDLIEPSPTTGQDEQIQQTSANVVSRVLSIMISSSTNSSLLELKRQYSVNCMKLLSGFILNLLEPGEDAVTLGQFNFSMILQKNYAYELRNRQYTYEVDSGGIGLPLNPVNASTNSQVITLQFISYSHSDNIIWLSDISKNISSSIVTFKFMDDQGNKILFSSQEPIVITLNKYSTLISNYTYSCRYNDELTQLNTEWSDTGCWLSEITDESVVCHCNHTTSFAAFIQTSLEDVAQIPEGIKLGEHITKITVHGVYAIVNVILIIILLIYRERQPIRSRLYGPVICLFSILVENILQIVQSSLWLPNKPNVRAINAIGFTIVAVANPLEILSLLVFLWQNIRYIMMRSMYQWMNFNNSTQFSIRFKITRFFTSKIVFIGVTIMFYLFLVTYYVIFAIVSGVGQRSLSEESTTRTTLTGALSYFSMLMLMAICIVTAFIWHTIWLPIQKNMTAKHTQKQNSAPPNDMEYQLQVKESNPINLLQTIKFYLIDDDPLYFRLNTMIMVVSVLIGLASFTTGITNQYKSQFLYVWLPLDLIYTGIRIIAFGGFVVLIMFRSIIGSSNNITYESMNMMISSGASKEQPQDTNLLDDINDVLNNEIGFDLLLDFCRVEFSVENMFLHKELSILNFDWMLMSADQRLDVIRRMHDVYIARNSPYQVNIPSPVFKLFVRLTKQCSSLPLQEQFQILRKVCL